MLAEWLAFTEHFEGGVPYLYADIRGLITIAFGNLVDPMSTALELPLRHPGGVPATKAEISAAWLAVKGDPHAAAYGHLYALKLSTLRLTREGMAGLALGKLASNNVELLRRLPDLEDYPACAQMALHSLAWACGAGANFPKLFAACKVRDWDAAAVHIVINEWTTDDKGARILNRGLVPRNVANRILMRNAARVEAFHLDPDLIEWTVDLGVAEAPTLPALPTAADEPTAIVHVDPSLYFLDKDPDDAA